MTATDRFIAYASAFEKSYADDDWSHVRPFFSDDAVYEVELGPPFGGRFEGRDAILAYFRRILDGFDRRFAERRVTLLEGPVERGGEVWVRGRAAYRADGVPDLAFDLEETATFEGDRITRLVDRYDPATREAMEAWLADHGDTLGIG